MFPRKAITRSSLSHDLNFEACSNGVDARITSTGGANRTRINGAGNRVAATGAARVDHNPVTLASRGLLQEPGRVQLLTAPNDVTNAAWSKAGVTASAADTLRETAGNAYHYIVEGKTTAVGEVCVMYCEAKADGRTAAIVQIANGSDALQAAFDFNNLAAGGYAVTFGTASAIQRAYRVLEDGWIGLQVSGVYSASASFAGAHVFLLDSAFSSLYNGDVTKGIKVRNLNFGPGRFATSPILSATTATAAEHFLTGSNFSSYFTPQGTYLIEFTPYALTENDVFWGIGQAGVFGNSMYLVHVGGSIWLFIVSGGVSQGTLNLGPLTAGTRCKVGISYQAGEIAARANGGPELVSAGSMPAGINAEGLLVAPWGGGGNYPAAHLHRRRHSPVPRRNELYSLTV